ncbi:hypothetical protein [Streptomyces cavernae]|uniref:hypothetical protein n=1 Tax=Streptomyces cavernae TaxID=2259034 RepID=UPI000FEC0632|nr:hypothetical protein [Streptomyces cavernae]
MSITHKASPTSRTRHSVALVELTPSQRALAKRALVHLGLTDGLIEPEPTETDAATRALITWATAAALGITVSPGHELAQCYDCRDILDGAHVTETNGRLHCAHCRPHDD